MQRTYDISGMHCQSCVAKVAKALESVAGVASARVSLYPPQARVDMGPHVPTESLDQAVKTAGDYQVTEAKIAATSDAVTEGKESLYPLFLVVGYILGTVALVAITTGERSPHELMRYFMAAIAKSQWASYAPAIPYRARFAVGHGTCTSMSAVR
jgi:copper chaperone CopZ